MLIIMEVSIIKTNGILERRKLDSLKNLDNIRLLTAINPNEETRLMLKLTDLPIKELALDDVPFYFLHRSIHFFKNLRKSKSKESGAIYVARSENIMDGLLLQYLPPNSSTSMHYHKLKTETFHNLEGKCILTVDYNSITLDKTTGIVHPKQIHQLKTNAGYALNLLKVEDDPKGLSLDDHHYP